MNVFREITSNRKSVHRNPQIWWVMGILTVALLLGATSVFAGSSSPGENGRAVPMFGGGPPPGAPQLHRVIGCTDAPAPTLSWDPVEGAITYRIEIYETDPNDPKDQRRIVDLDVESTSYTSSTHFWHGFLYRWRVRGFNPAGAGAFSEFQQFTFCSTDKAWEIDTFDELKPGMLGGQNGWAARGASPRVVPFEDRGNILRVDRLDQRSMIAIKRINPEGGNIQRFEFDFMITGAEKESLATLSLETNRLLGWDKVVRFKIGRSINLIGVAGKPLPMGSVVFGHWYTIRCDMDLDREELTVSLDGEIIFKDMPMLGGPINRIRITGQRGLGEVRFDNLVGYELPQSWQVEIIDPREDETVNGDIDVTVNTGARTEWVEFYLDHVLLNLDGDPPYQFSLATTGNPLPQPNHPMDFGYYFVEWKNPADFDAARKEVADYTNLFYASRASYDSGLTQGEWLALFEISMANAANEGRAIHLALDTEESWDAMLEIARPYWQYVERIEVGDEPDLTRAETEAILQSLQVLLSSKGLDPRPLGFVYRYTEPLPDAVNAPSLDWVGIEAYVDPPGSPETTDNIAELQVHLQWLMDQVPEGKDIVLVMMAYDRNGQWENLDTLRELQLAAYWLAFDDPRVVSINMFAYSRAGGTRDHPSLITPHKLIADRILKLPIPFGGDGRRTISVRAVDNLGNEIWDHVHVFVENSQITPEPSWTPSTTPAATPLIPTPSWTSTPIGSPKPPIGTISPTPPLPTSTPVLTSTATLPPAPSPTPTTGIPTPSGPEIWEFDDFSLPLGPLAGQNGWEAGRESAEVIWMTPLEKGLLIDPSSGKTIEMHKDVPDQNEGTLFFGLTVKVLDAVDPSIAKVVIETYQNNRWDRKFQIYFGDSIRVNTSSTGHSVSILDQVELARVYRIDFEINTDTERMKVYVDERVVATDVPVHPGPITGLSISGWDRTGAVILDTLLGMSWGS